jgi:hypothetical protein
MAARVGRRQNLDDWLARSPLIEIVFDAHPRRHHVDHSPNALRTPPRGEA